MTGEEYDTVLFYGSKLKIKRADRHIEDLRLVLAAFLKTQFYRLHVEKNPDDGSSLLKCEVTEPMPSEVPLLIGDTIHNLRAALDLLVCEIIRLAGETPSKWADFPIRDSRDGLVNTLNGAQLKTVAPWIVDLLIDEIKPYDGGNDSLYALHRLDIDDKHKLLIPATSVTALTGAAARDDHGNIFEGLSFYIGQTGKITMIETDSSLEITNYGQPSFAVLFGKGQVLQGEAVIPTLRRLSEVVSGVVQTIETAYLSNIRPQKSKA